MGAAVTARPSSVPVTVMPAGSVTCTTTSVSMATVVSWVTDGGSGPPSWPRSVKNSPSSAIAGMAIAVSFSQYWKACTKVIERMPPATTLVMTMPPTTTGPIHTGMPSRVLSARPAPWYCGTRYTTQITVTTSIATLRSRRDPSRNSAKSGTV